MNPAILNSQFVQVALPIVLTIFIAAWMNGRTMDVIGKRIDDLNKRIDLTCPVCDKGFHQTLGTD